MRRKRQSRNKMKFLKIILGVVIIILAVVILCRTVQKVALSSNYFKVQYVVVEPESSSDSIYDFVKKRVLGKNIFQVNLGALSNDIADRFSDVSKAVLIRRFPNKIRVNIILRKPLAKLSLPSGKLYYLDKEATLVLASSHREQFDDLPFVKGLNNSPSRTQLRKITSLLKSINTADFKINLILTKIDVDSRGEFTFFLKQGFYVKIGNRDFERRLERLKLLLGESNFNIAKLKYIDIRFREPSLVYKRN